ncbi:hypothetical protein ACROYT_G043445 [Oculina patagonica]
MSIFRFASVIAQKSLSYRPLSLAWTMSVHGSSKQNDQRTDIVVPPNAFQLFSRGKRERAVDNFSDKTDKDTSKTLSNKWKGISETEKSSRKRAYTQKEIYNAALAKLPKKPLAVFGLFVKENYSKVAAGLIPGVSARVVMPALSDKWNSLSNEEKEQLKQKHDKMLEEYKQQVISFWQELTAEERTFLEEKHGPKMRQLEKEGRHFLGYPKSPPSPFLLFVQRSANGMEIVSVIERTKMLGQKWRAMSKEEKEVYFEENRQAHEQYKKDIIEWKAKYPEAA